LTTCWRDGYRFAKGKGESIVTNPGNPCKQPLSCIGSMTRRAAVQIRFIAILKLPFKV
jgi:hypothetical protein